MMIRERTGDRPLPVLMYSHDGVGLGHMRRNSAIAARLVSEVAEHLTPGGTFLVEVAPEQAAEVAAWCDQAGLGDVEIRRDLAQRERLVAARSQDGEAEPDVLFARRRPGHGPIDICTVFRHTKGDSTSVG